MLKLLLVRHGQTRWNVERRIQGWLDSELTPLGVRQAEWLRERLRETDLAAIYASPLGRARRTAGIVRDGRDLSIRIVPELKEIGFGELEGLAAADILAEHPDFFAEFRQAPHLYQPVSGESYTDLRDRVIPAMDTIIGHHESGTLLVVSHGCALRVILAHFLGWNLADIPRLPALQPTAVNMVELDGGEIRVPMLNDVSHYQEDEAG